MLTQSTERVGATVSKACVGCDSHRITTTYNRGAQSLYLNHICSKKGTRFLRASAMPRSCKDRSERASGEAVAVEAHRTEEYLTQEAVDDAV